MINKIKQIYDIQRPYGLVVNVNEDEVISLDITVKAGGTTKIVTSVGDLVLEHDGEVVKAYAGAVFGGRATAEIGNGLDAGKYDLSFVVIGADFEQIVTGVLISKVVVVGAVRNAAVEADVANSVSDVSVIKEQIGVEGGERIYIDTSVFPALPKMDRVEYEAQSTVASYNHVSHDATLDTLISAQTPVSTLPFRRLTEAEKTLVIAGDYYAHNMDDANKIYVSAYVGGINEYTGVTDWWYSLDNMVTLSLHSSLVSDGYTTSFDSVATAAMELADSTKWYKVFNIIKDDVPYQYVISADKTTDLVTRTLAFAE